MARSPGGRRTIAEIGVVHRADHGVTVEAAWRPGADPRRPAWPVLTALLARHNPATEAVPAMAALQRATTTNPRHARASVSSAIPAAAGSRGWPT